MEESVLPQLQQRKIIEAFVQIKKSRQFSIKHRWQYGKISPADACDVSVIFLNNTLGLNEQHYSTDIQKYFLRLV